MHDPQTSLSLFVDPPRPKPLASRGMSSLPFSPVPVTLRSAALSSLVVVACSGSCSSLPGPSASNGLIDFVGDLAPTTTHLPFPHHGGLASGIHPNHKSQQSLDHDVVGFYEQWKSDYLKDYLGTDITYIAGDITGDVPPSWPRGIRSVSQSEATGYGMIIFALMAGHDPHARAYFDGLVKLYLANQSQYNNANMSWVIPEKYDPSLEKAASASDGDFDIAYALLLADKQWGSTAPGLDYQGLAKKMLSNGILEFDISERTNRVLLGDWGKGKSGGPGRHPIDRYNETSTRPSDWVLDHLRAFDKAYPNPRWAAIIAETEKLFAAVQDPNTGLYPDFVEDLNGTPQKVLTDIPYTDEAGQTRYKYLESDADDDYGWNACRVPWRLATDYAHYGRPGTGDALRRLNRWSTSLSKDSRAWPGSIWHGYTLDGEKLNPGDDWSWSLAFTAPMVSALIVDAQNQDYLNSGWEFMSTHFLGDHSETEGWSGYYPDTISLLNMLLISGNWWNPAA